MARLLWPSTTRASLIAIVSGWLQTVHSRGIWSHLRQVFFIWQTHKHRDPYFQGGFLRFPAKRESKVLGPLSLLGGSGGGSGGSGRRRCAFLQWFAYLMKMSDMLPPSVQFLVSRDTPGPESPGRPLVAKIPGSHPPPGSSATLETIAQSLFGHSPPPSLTYAAPGGSSSSGPQPLQSRSSFSCRATRASDRMRWRCAWALW